MLNITSVRGNPVNSECQCNIGRDKLLSAPVHPQLSQVPSPEDGERGFHTAPPTRSPIQVSPTCGSHILVTFRSPTQYNNSFQKAFPSATPIKYAKIKLGKLLGVSASNLVLAKNRVALKESLPLSDVKGSAWDALAIDVFTKDNSTLSLSSIPKQSYVEEILKPDLSAKKVVEFVAIKFKILLQNSNFTRSYPSIMKVHEVKKNLGDLFYSDPENLVMLRGKDVLKDRMLLQELDYDEFGNVEIELLTRDSKKINLRHIYGSVEINDVLSVTVPFGDIVKQINVEIIDSRIIKPYLGGYRNIHSNTEYHHAYTQTQQKPEKVPPESKNDRDTQTAEEREKIDYTPYERSTQMSGDNVYVPNVTDRIVVANPYETYDEMIARLNHNHYAAVIQRAYRAYRYRQLMYHWLKKCKERADRIREEERREKEAFETRLKKDLITKTFPRTREDFDQLYAMVDRWKNAEISRITKLHSKGPKIAEFSLLLDKEVELLRCIDAYRVKLKEDTKKMKEKAFLDEISKPVAWFGTNGKLITMDTLEVQRSRKLKDLFNSFCRHDFTVEQRMELLVDFKYALKDFRHPLTDEITSLLDRECDLLVRNCNDGDLEFLRKRIRVMVLQFIKTSELNAGVTRRKDVKDFKEMSDGKLYLCEMCNECKIFTEFPLHSKASGFFVCKSCSWKNITDKCWVDMTPYKFILRAVQRDERKRKCWGSLAFVLQEKDVYFIIEKLWHSHSAISESSDMVDLRLCRWHVQEDWSPWNCFLVTVAEMKAHLKLEDPENVYDAELIQKVKNKHMLAKTHFEQLVTVNKRFTESGTWQAVKAPALAFVNGVEPL